ncbi:MAG: trigger factor [Treponema sp.]|nr:trigger factor [Treponema sp.]
MTISKEITPQEKSSVRMDVTIGKEDLRSEYDDLLKEYTKTIQIPGFRRGKVPRDVLERKFGDALKGEAMGKIIEKAVEEIFKNEEFPRESRPLPYSRPELKEEPKIDFEKDLEFSVVYDVLPTVKLGKWEGLEVAVPELTLGDQELNQELEAIRERNSIVLDKDEEEGAQNQDVLTLDFCELDEKGEPIESTKRQDFTFTLGSGYNIYKFDEEVMGIKKGETREFTKTYGEDHEDKDLAGSSKTLRVQATALKVKKLPDLDDDLAQDVDEKFKTLEDLKTSISERLQKNLDQQLRASKVNKILEKIMEDSPVEIPESMILMELDSHWRNMARRFNTDSDGLYKMIGNSQEQAQAMLDTWRPSAETALHSRLIIETLIENLDLQASDDEAEKEIERLASETGSTIEDVKKYYEEGNMMDYLKEEIKERKVYDILIEKSTISYEKIQDPIDPPANIE